MSVQTAISRMFLRAVQSLGKVGVFGEAVDVAFNKLVQELVLLLFEQEGPI